MAGEHTGTSDTGTSSRLTSDMDVDSEGTDSVDTERFSSIVQTSISSWHGFEGIGEENSTHTEWNGFLNTGTERNPEGLGDQNMVNPDELCEGGDVNDMDVVKDLAAFESAVPGHKDEPLTRADLQSAVILFLDAKDEMLKKMDERLPDTPHSAPEQHKGIRRQVQHRDMNDIKQQAKLRFFIMGLMGRDGPKDPIDVASDDEVGLFKRNRHPGPSLSLVKFYLGQELSCTWNKKAVDMVAKAFIASGYSTCENKDLAKKMVRTHLFTLQDQYKKQGRGDEPTQAEREVQTAENAEQRRRGLHTRRSEARQAHRHLRTDEFNKLWSLLDYTAQSGDESEIRSDGQTHFIRTRLPWRSETFIKFLHVHDYVHLTTRFHPNGKPRRGRFPRYRILGSSRIDEFDSPVSGLPINCYDDEWLAGLDQIQRDELKMLPPMDLSLSADLKECVSSTLTSGDVVLIHQRLNCLVPLGL
ncbi:hypothetical protein EIP86_007268 [Pleurotus ostreatoroseus]|nr:hypothetical protein EIP86_007268 [Pleurotus ostreatoroseus]